MICTLNQLKPGDSGIILRITGEGDLRRRMMEMGLIPGADIYVSRFGPFSGPMAIQTRGYQLALRKKEAKMIEVEVA